MLMLVNGTAVYSDTTRVWVYIENNRRRCCDRWHVLPYQLLSDLICSLLFDGTQFAEAKSHHRI